MGWREVGESAEEAGATIVRPVSHSAGMESSHSRATLCYFCVALSASLGLGLAIAYLEVKRNAELSVLQSSLREALQEVDLLRQRVDHCLNRTSDLNDKLDKVLSQSNRTVADTRSAGPDEEYEYYDDYEDESGDSPPTKSGDRKRRDINPLLPRYNMILRQGYKSNPNRSGNPEVQAKIIVESPNAPVNPMNPSEPEFYIGQKPQTIVFLDKLPAIHLEGDTSAHTRGSRTYDHQGRLRHEYNEHMKDWRIAEWALGNQQYFNFNKMGVLTLQDSHNVSGIYFVYAQVFYDDNDDTRGFHITVNGFPVFQCSVTSLSHPVHNTRTTKRNSCFTGGLTRLHRGDRVMIKEVDGRPWTIFDPHKSYFGLFKLNGN